jgi:hypothetical protein
MALRASEISMKKVPPHSLHLSLFDIDCPSFSKLRQKRQTLLREYRQKLLLTGSCGIMWAPCQGHIKKRPTY